MFPKANPSLIDLLKAGAFIELPNHIVLRGLEEFFCLGEKLTNDTWRIYQAYYYTRKEMNRLWKDVADHAEWTRGYEDVSV